VPSRSEAAQRAQPGQEILDAADEQLVRGGHGKTLLRFAAFSNYAANVAPTKEGRVRDGLEHFTYSCL
jgi:hypothetical protein